MNWYRFGIGVAIFGYAGMALIGLGEMIAQRQSARKQERVVLMHPTYYNRSPA